MLHVNVDLYHTTNRTATTNGPISLAGTASLGKYGYGNGTYIRNCPTTYLSISCHQLSENAYFLHKKSLPQWSVRWFHCIRKWHLIFSENIFVHGVYYWYYTTPFFPIHLWSERSLEVTHHYIFRQRGREGRLLRLIADTLHLDLGTSYGIGIDEDTALIITETVSVLSNGSGQTDGGCSIGLLYQFHKN